MLLLLLPPPPLLPPRCSAKTLGINKSGLLCISRYIQLIAIISWPFISKITDEVGTPVFFIWSACETIILVTKRREMGEKKILT